MNRSELFSKANKKMWAGMTAEQRSEATAPAVKASLISRGKDSLRIRRERAARNGRAISPTAAKARAVKAWATKKAKAAAAKSQAVTNK